MKTIEEKTMEINNIVVKNLTEEMGKRIITAFNKLGVNTRCLRGNLCEQDNDTCIYYGVISGEFCFYTLPQIQNCKVITIEELEAMANGEPKEGDTIYVWNNAKPKEFIELDKRIFLAKFSRGFICVARGDEIRYKNNQSFDTLIWKNYALKPNNDALINEAKEQINKLSEQIKELEKTVEQLRK